MEDLKALTECAECTWDYIDRLRMALAAACKDRDEVRKELHEAKSELAAMRNELCYLCGNYREAHNGACDGCRWRNDARCTMKILVACEESQAVTIELRRLGHEAYSCDIQECSGGHPEWHIKGDVLPLLNGDCEFNTMNGERHAISGRWDMIIAFPPCTKTSNAGARHLWKGGKLNISRYYEGLCGKALFLAIWAADCDRVVIENPTPSKIYQYPEPMQVIQPCQFGHPVTKRTLLWGRGVEPLKPTNIVEPERTWCPSGSYSGKHDEKHRGMFTTDRAKNRSKTFPGIARAMAEQWAGPVEAALKGGDG